MGDKQLSVNFKLSELTSTSSKLPNDPNEEEMAKLEWLAKNLLQPIRDAIGPLKITSCFRSELVNAAAGGAVTSQHRLAEAADIQPLERSLEEAFEWIKGNMKFGQLIFEEAHGAKWIHVSRERESRPNQMCLRYDGKQYINA